MRRPPAEPPAASPAPAGNPGEGRPAAEGEDRLLAAHLRTLSRLSPGIAHDLRAPINAMVFNLEILRESLLRQATPAAPADARLLRYAEILGEELGRLHGRLEVLFSYLRPAGQRQEGLSLAAALDELETVLVPTARKRQIQVDCEAPETASLPGDAAAARQALLQVATLALAEVAPQGRLSLTGEVGRNGLRIRIEGAPCIPGASGAGETAPALDLARDLLEPVGGIVRHIANSVSNEPTLAYEVEFPESWNAAP